MIMQFFSKKLSGGHYWTCNRYTSNSVNNFWFAINMNPKHLSTAIVNGDSTLQTNYLIEKINNTNHFDIKYQNCDNFNA